MNRRHATISLAANGLGITAAVSGGVNEVVERCGIRCHVKGAGEPKGFRRQEDYEMKWKLRKEYHDAKNREKSIRNSKDSLDSTFEKKRGLRKSTSEDLERVRSGTLVQKRRRENSVDKMRYMDSLVAEVCEKPNGIPRSVSDMEDIRKRKVKKWCESDLYKTGNRVSRRDSAFVLVPVGRDEKFLEKESSKQTSDDAESQSVYVEVRENSGKKCCRSEGEKDKIFRNIRSRSATIPRKWSEHSLSTPSATSDEVDDLPDGSCFRRTIHRPNLRRNLNRNSAAIRAAKYVGSFPVAGADQTARAEYVRNKLLQFRGNVTIRPVLLVISLSGIKVCSVDGKSVHMAHALKRISYATCDPEGTQFSFLAREPRGHFSLQYCHSFVTQTPEQVFCMRIMGRLGRRKTGASSRPFLRVHYRKLVEDYADASSPMAPLPDYFSYCCCRCGHTQKVKAEELNSIVGNAFRMAYAAQLQRQPTFQEVIASQLQDSPSWQKNYSSVEMNAKLRDTSSPRLSRGGKDPPKSIPGLRSVQGVDQEPLSNTNGSDENTSPTELNSYKKLTEKPPLIKRLAMGLTNNERTEDGRPLVSPAPPTSPVQRPLSGGYVNEAVADAEFVKPQIKQIEIDSTKSFQNSDREFKLKRVSRINSGSSCPASITRPPPPPPERTDSLTGKAEEEGELRAAPWFQAGIPREITLEVLGQEPIGAFMVRESTSKPGCYALSLRVPRDFQPSGIAHYLIMRTIKGYKIKGFTKEFTTLTALITHHSVMPELLPCPLSLGRFNASFEQSDSGRDFADTDSDPDYDTLADFRRMMADLNV